MSNANPPGVPGQPVPPDRFGEQAPQAVPPAVPPGSGSPVPGSPAYPGPPRSQGTDPRLTIQAGRYWAGALATALVAGLIGMIGVVIFERVLNVPLVPPPDVFSTSSHQLAYAAAGAILALIAAAILHGLTLAAPRPRAFFGWIMALFTVAWAVLPFAWTSDTLSAALSGVVNVLISVAIWSLLSGVAVRTTIIAPSSPASPA